MQLSLEFFYLYIITKNSILSNYIILRFKKLLLLNIKRNILYIAYKNT